MCLEKKSNQPLYKNFFISHENLKTGHKCIIAKLSHAEYKIYFSFKIHILSMNTNFLQAIFHCYKGQSRGQIIEGILLNSEYNLLKL